ncbi:MAG: 4-oxalocrotonate tautomerase family protein [Desulfobulbaceae bacterium]|nr:MAG: 4-oxalocrotonate tautomerase family protein [Desulfobulbaceae bacterium]
MPYVNIRVAEALSKQQKAEISAGVTEVIAGVADKAASSILIFIDELACENIASGGKPLRTPTLAPAAAPGPPWPLIPDCR